MYKGASEGRQRHLDRVTIKDQTTAGEAAIPKSEQAKNLTDEITRLEIQLRQLPRDSAIRKEIAARKHKLENQRAVERAAREGRGPKVDYVNILGRYRMLVEAVLGRKMNTELLDQAKREWAAEFGVDLKWVALNDKSGLKP